MKLEVNRLSMLEAAKSVAKIAPSNSPSEVLNNILIESSEDTGEVLLTAAPYPEGLVVADNFVFSLLRLSRCGQ